MWTYNYTNELYHYGVKGMKWGVRRELKKQAKQRMYKEQDSIENEMDKRIMKINRKYGQLGNNGEGKNARMNRATKKAYNKELDDNWNKYVNDMDKTRATYKQAKKNLKADTEREVERRQSKDYKDSRKLKEKHVSEMSNAEIKELNKRMQLEVDYNRLNPSATAKGKTYLMGAVAVTGAVLTLQGNSERLIKLGQKVLGV